MGLEVEFTEGGFLTQFPHTPLLWVVSYTAVKLPPVSRCLCAWDWAMSPAVAVYLKSGISAVAFALPMDAFLQLCTVIPDK